MKTLEFKNPKQAQKFFDVVSEIGDASLTIGNGRCIVMFDCPLHEQPNTGWLHCFKGVGVSHCEQVLGVRVAKGKQMFYIHEGVIQKEQSCIPFKGYLPK